MAEWNNSLPEIAEEFPDTWLIRADWHTQIGELPSAAFCFQRALKTHPNHVAGNYQLGQTLTRLGETEDASAFLTRAEHLRDLIKLSSILVSQYPKLDQSLLLEISDTLALVDRPLEAVCWLKFATQNESTLVRKQRLYEQLGGRISDNTPWTLSSFRIAEELEFSVDDWQSAVDASGLLVSQRKAPKPIKSKISFREATESLGIDHRYMFGVTDDVPTGRIYEVTGGGIATIDFDLDDWPDLYFTQAGTSPPFQAQEKHLDQLYRNYAGRRFKEVAELAGIRDELFGQGVASGDIDNDGFPDLYVANFDGNRIYLNNGDGTFSDATYASNVSHSYWTTSCAIADITGDSIPDLYDVTYVTGDNVLTQTCSANGVAGTCSPLEFTSTPDLLWQGLGDRSFNDASESQGITVPDGDGLALVIGAFSDYQRSRIFIANDGRANFYFKPADTHNANHSKPARYAEEALMRGAAFDIEGRPQACMGIASSDFNGDLRQDFVVTNFIAESNTLYLQSDDEHYLDQSRTWDIYESSLQTLGFGSQALDADLDGWPDIMIANGHINSHPVDAPQQRMVPQFYRNIVGTKFRQLSGENLGPYFEKPAIGRSMAVVDWNRDGRPEVAISQLRDNSSLLENTTENSGAWLTLKLHGKDCSRDAVGCRVIVSTPLRKQLSLVTAGDGYQCSNQKQLFFGLGRAESIDSLTVFWPNGRTQTFTNIRPNTRLSIREGDQDAFICP